jgi:hypothetical protein
LSVHLYVSRSVIDDCNMFTHNSAAL